MSYDKEQAIAWAKTQVGFHEGPNNSNPYSVWQGLDNNNPWCASFVCQAAWQGGYRFSDSSTFGERGEAYCPTMAERAKAEGLWRPRDWRALPGDFVLFDWGNNGLIDHVEQVNYDDGNHIIDIGGNTSDSVAYRTRPRDNVAGFYALSQSDQAVVPLDPKALAAILKLLQWKAAVTAKPLRLLDRGPNVEILNDLLRARGLVARRANLYGKATRRAVHYFKQGQHFADPDGTIFGGPAAAALLAPH